MNMINLAISVGMTINLGGKSYKVIQIEDNCNRPNTRREYDKCGIRDNIIVQRGKKYYSIIRYNNGMLGKVIGY